MSHLAALRGAAQGIKLDARTKTDAVPQPALTLSHT